MGREPRGIEPVFITTAQAAACLGPTTQPPWGKLHNSPRVRLELPARETGREYLLRGGHLGAGAFSVVGWLFTIHHSPFTVYFHRPLARKGGSNYPHGNPLGRTYEGGCPAIGHQAAPGPPVGRCAQGVTTGTAAGPKVAICATQNARAPAQAKTAFPSVSTFFTGDTGDTL